MDFTKYRLTQDELDSLSNGELIDLHLRRSCQFYADCRIKLGYGEYLNESACTILEDMAYESWGNSNRGYSFEDIYQELRVLAKDAFILAVSGNKVVADLVGLVDSLADQQALFDDYYQQNQGYKLAKSVDNRS